MPLPGGCALVNAHTVLWIGFSSHGTRCTHMASSTGRETSLTLWKVPRPLKVSSFSAYEVRAEIGKT